MDPNNLIHHIKTVGTYGYIESAIANRFDTSN